MTRRQRTRAPLPPTWVPRYRWQPITDADVLRTESQAVQVLPPAVAVAVLAYLRMHAKNLQERTDPRSELSRLVRDVRYLALGDLPD